MTSPNRLARTAGVLYLCLAVLGGFAHLYSRAAVYRPGDAAATADLVVANASIVRFGFVADLVQTTLFVFLAFALYLLLEQVHRNVARAMVVLVAIAAAIMCLNLVHHLAALIVATEETYTAALGPDGSDALVLLMLDLHHYGYLIAQMFFGLWLVPLGYLVHRSGMFPRWVGPLLVAGCVAYLLDMFRVFLVPELGASVSAYLTIPAAAAELAMVALLLKGVKVPRPQERVLAAT